MKKMLENKSIWEKIQPNQTEYSIVIKLKYYLKIAGKKNAQTKLYDWKQEIKYKLKID